MKNYEEGSIVNGRVSGIEDYGIFVSLDNGTTGLIHISEISDSFVKNVGDYAKINNTITAQVLDYDEKHDKLKLSLKSLHEEKKKANHEEIVETKSGFDGLKKNLDLWITEKEEEIRKKQKKS